MSRRGGTERMTALLANALSKEHTVFIISLSFSGEKVFFPLDDSVEHRVLPPAGGKLGIIKHIANIRRIIKEEKIDRIINVDIGMGIYGVLAAMGTKSKVITWEHANYFNNWNSRIFPYLRRFAAKYSDALVVLTNRDKKNYETHINAKTPITAIPNPVSKTEFTYDINSKIILSAGQLLPIKGFDKIVEIGKQIFAVHPNWIWHICGDGPEKDSLQSAVVSSGLEKNIILCGSVEDMESRYRNAAMYVMTSKSEGLPMVLLEAKSYGVPIVSFDIMTGPSDIVRDGSNGYLVPPDDTRAMTDKILTLIENDALRQTFSSNSQLDMEKFDWNNIINQWSSLLEEV